MKEIRKEIFPVVGMSCASCAARVEKTLKGQPGVQEALVNYASGAAQVAYCPDTCSSLILKTAVQHAGYDLLIGAEKDEAEEMEKIQFAKYQSLKIRTLVAIVLSIPIMVLSMMFMHLRWVQYVVWLLATPVVFGMGRGFFLSAWKQLRHGTCKWRLSAFL